MGQAVDSVETVSGREERKRKVDGRRMYWMAATVALASLSYRSLATEASPVTKRSLEVSKLDGVVEITENAHNELLM